MNPTYYKSIRDVPVRMEPEDWGWLMDGDVVTHLVFGIPGTTTDTMNMNWIPVRKGQKIQGAWEWDGNMTEPTITSSIRISGAHTWHGYMTKGKFVTLPG